MEKSPSGSNWIGDFSALIEADRDVELALDRAHGTIGHSQYRPPFAEKLYLNANHFGLSAEDIEFIRHAHNVRNARVQEDSGVTVSEEFLHRYQAIAKQLNPKRSAFELLVIAQAGGTTSGVLAAQPSDQLRTVLIQMATGDFSQVPAYDGERLLGLLTAERLLMYIASSLKADPDPIVEIDLSIRISDVAGAITPCPRFSVDTSPLVILEAFRESEIGGNPLTAVIITQHGRADEKPLAIISAADLPLLA